MISYVRESGSSLFGGPKGRLIPLPGGQEGVCPFGGGRAAAGGRTAIAAVPFERSENKKIPGARQSPGDRKTAATYSPNWWVSTIGDGELNFSVRNGKRWILTAITTVVYYLREKVAEGMFPSVKQSDFACCFATSRLSFP